MVGNIRVKFGAYSPNGSWSYGSRGKKISLEILRLQSYTTYNFGTIFKLMGKNQWMNDES